MKLTPPWEQGVCGCCSSAPWYMPAAMAWPGWPSQTHSGPGETPTPVSDATDGDLFSTDEQESREGNAVPWGGEQAVWPGKAQ